MKATKLIALLLVLVMCFAIVACSKKEENPTSTQKQEESSSSTKKEESSSSSSSSSSSQQGGDPQGDPYVPTTETAFEVKDGNTKTITFDLTKIDTSKDITITMDLKHNKAISGGDTPNGYLAVNDKGVIRCTTGKGLHIYDNVGQVPCADISTNNGEPETDPCIWKSSSMADKSFTVVLTINIDDDYLGVKLDASVNAGRIREKGFTVDFKNALELKFMSCGTQNISVSNLAFDFTAK